MRMDDRALDDKHGPGRDSIPPPSPKRLVSRRDVRNHAVGCKLQRRVRGLIGGQRRPHLQSCGRGDAKAVGVELERKVRDWLHGTVRKRELEEDLARSTSKRSVDLQALGLRGRQQDLYAHAVLSVASSLAAPSAPPSKPARRRRPRALDASLCIRRDPHAFFGRTRRCSLPKISLMPPSALPDARDAESRRRRVSPPPPRSPRRQRLPSSRPGTGVLGTSACGVASRTGIRHVEIAQR